ncbi:hypothetical protein PLICRDRAFT_173984 [Plicaturopsis crispa FD-325 SS-3]|nr:hypothetical protein PLICRDRAFT_173984 [Plicaturopsis crispa FD-325 SS-3]
MTSTLPPIIQALSGALGSAAANTLTYPLSLATTRLQSLPPPPPKHLTGVPGALRVIRSIRRRWGTLALWDGVAADTAASVLSTFLYFYIYAFLRYLSLRRKNGRKVLSGWEELALGFGAGVASRALSTPLSVVAVRLQMERAEVAEAEEKMEAEEKAEAEEAEKMAGARDASGASPDEGVVIADLNNSVTAPDEENTQIPQTGLYHVVLHLYAEGGLLAFWKGFTNTIILCLNPALTLAFFQRLSLLQHTLRSHWTSRTPALTPPPAPSPFTSFGLAALSNSIAVTLLYPLILAKVRAQAGIETTGTLQDFGSTKTMLWKHYQALEAHILKGCVGQGVTFLLKARMVSHFLSF